MPVNLETYSAWYLTQGLDETVGPDEAKEYDSNADVSAFLDDLFGPHITGTHGVFTGSSLIDAGIVDSRAARVAADIGVGCSASGLARVTVDALGITSSSPMRMEAGIRRTAHASVLVSAGVSDSTTTPLLIEIEVRYIRDWRLQLYDKDGALTAILDNLPEASAERRIAEAGSVSWSLPAEDPKAGELSLARSWRLYRGSEPVASGRLIARQIAESPWRYEGLTNEVELERIQLPALWGELYRGWDLADVVRDLLKERRVYRRNTLAHWQAAVEAVNVDLQADPGYVVLARDPYLDGRRYRASGYITLQFDAPGGLWAWERARWSEIVGEDVRITLQYRTSTDGGRTWSAWSSELEAVDAEDLQANEEVGVLLSNTGGALQLRINLRTEDRDTPFYDELPPDTQQTYGRTPILTGLEVMMSRPGPVRPHPTDFPTGSAGVTIPDPPDWSDSNALAALQDLYELTGWEWYVDGENYLHLAAKLGQDRTGDYLLREGTNVHLEVLEDDDEELVNVLTARGAGEGYAQLQVVMRHEQSIADHDGVEFHRVVEWGDIDDPAELEARAQEYLDQHAYAQPRMRGLVCVPHGPEPVLDLGDTVRVVHPKSRTIVQARVLDIQRAITSEGEEWRVGLNASWDQGSLVDRLSGRPGPEARKVLARPTLTATGYYEGIRLALRGPKPYRVQHTATFDAEGRPKGWRDLEALTEAQEIDHAPLEFESRHAYRARCVIGGRPGPWTEPVVALARDTYAPDPPQGVQIQQIFRGFRVSYTKPPEDRWKVTHCEVLTEEGGQVIVVVPDQPGRQTAFTFEEGEPGREYWARLWIEDRSGNLSTAVESDRIQAGYHHIRDSDAIRNVLSYTYADSLDASHKLDCVFYMPPETLAIRSAKVYVKGQPYRAYSLAAALQELWDRPTSSASVPHTHPFRYSYNARTSRSGSHSHNYQRTSGMSSAGDHSHQLTFSTRRSDGVYEWLVEVPNHTHQYSGASGMYSAGGHAHNLTYSTASTTSAGDHDHAYDRLESIDPPLDHQTAHSHTVDISHGHDLVFGIYEETDPTDVTVEVSDDDGTTWKTVRSGLTAPVEATIDIAQYLSTAEGYKHVRFSSSRRGRIAAMVLLDLHIDNV